MSWEIKKKFNDFEVSRQISPLKQITMASKKQTTQTVTNNHTMTQQTAVEWLDNELWKIRLKLRGGEISIGLYSEQEVKLIEQAKQMEKQQIVDSFDAGYRDYASSWYETGKQYFNETYNNTNNAH